MTLTTDQKVDQLGLVLTDILAELRHIRVELAERVGAESSVEIKTSARGADLTCKSYSSSPIRAAGDAAVDEYVRLTAELAQRLTAAANGR